MSQAPLDLDKLPTTASGYARRYLRVYLIGGTFLAAFQIAMNRIDWLGKSTVDRIFAAVPVSALSPGLMMVGLGVLAFVLRLTSRWFLFNAGRDAEYEIRAQFLHKLHRLGTSFYRRYSSGEIMSRATADLAQVRLLFGFGVLNIVNVVFAFASALQVMVHISGRLTVAAFVTLPVMVIVTRLLSKQMFTLTRTSQAELGRLGDLAQRHFSGIRIVRSFAIEAFAESRFAQAAMRFLRASLALARTRGTMFPLLGAINAASLLIVAWYGASLLRHHGAPDGIGEGDFFAFLLAWSRMAWPMMSFGMTIAVMQRGRACFERLREIIEMQPEVVEPTGTPAAVPEPTGLRVSHLRYETNGRVILDDVSFEVAAGRSLAIVGRTGAGKSTLATLLVRLLPTARGTVFLDGRDVCDLDRDTLRRRIAYAQQDPFLFSTSVADNVAIGLDVRPGDAKPDAEIDAALRDAQIADEVASLPDGRETLVGERGVQLSGGQRQRVALARALVSPTPLLVLDDPLSAVDARTEAAILDALRRRGEVRSTILITHRIAAAARCERIMVLEAGRVTQLGTHAELVSQPGLYARLAEEQRVQGELEALGASAETAIASKVTSPVAVQRGAGGEDALPQGTDLRLLVRLWPYLHDQRAAIFGAFAILIAMIGVTLLRPLAMGRLTGAATSGAALLWPGLALLAVLTTTNVLAFAQLFLTQVAGARAMVALRLHLFRFIDGLGLRTFDRTPIGRLVTRVVNDVEAVGEMFSMGVLNALGDIISLVAIVAMMLALDWQLSLIAFCALPVTGLIVLFVRRGAREAYRAIRTKTAQLNGILNEQVTGIAVVQAFGRERAMAASFDVVNVAYRDANKRAIIVESGLDAAVEMVQTICVASVLLWAGHVRGSGGVLSFAIVITFTQYLRQFFEPVSMLTQRFTTLQSALASTERIFQLLDTTETEPQDEPASAEAPVAATISQEAFALEHVDFAYREGRPVLHDITLSAKRGERIALVGPTGAGKSTITQLLLRLYDVDVGVVRVLGTEVKRWPRRTLRRAFSVVPQEVMLFSGSLLDNIALGDDAPDRARALDALDRLGLRERFEKREGGLDAHVDERALNFSVGERQLLSFARALYHDAPILLLDEATASIDSETESQLQAALDQLMVGRTTLVIAHRLSTIERADRILVFQAGRIVESGPHAQLIADNGLYARLHALQLRKAEVETSSVRSTG